MEQSVVSSLKDLLGQVFRGVFSHRTGLGTTELGVEGLHLAGQTAEQAEAFLMKLFDLLGGDVSGARE